MSVTLSSGSSRCLRVLMLSTDLNRGGLPLRLVQLARALPAAGVTPIVGCLSRPGPLSEELASAGIETFACDAAGRFDASCLARLARHIARIDPDLIHASLFHANLAARLVGRVDRRRPILTSSVTIEIERRWHRPVEALTAGASDLHVANSAAVASHLVEDLGFPPSRVRVVPNAVDLAAIDAAAPVPRAALGRGDPLMVWAGRMDPVKNLGTFVAVVEEVSKRRHVLAALVGDGPARARTEALIARRGLAGVIRLAGWQDAVAAWLKAAAVLLFPSHTEGSPNVVLEAMAARCPVVASNVPACVELLGDDRGWLCPPRDVACLSRAVEQVLSDNDARRRRVQSAREYVEKRHALQDVVATWRTLYDELVAGSQS